MLRILRKVIYLFNIYLKPSDIEREKKRWDKDGGDDKLRYDYDIDSKSLVIDVGGYQGRWAEKIFETYNSHIIIIEPVKEYYVNINEKFKNNHKVNVFPVAFGAENREEYISLCDDGTSIFRNSKRTEIIQYLDVVDFYHKNNIDIIDLIKINVEGGEYEILPRLIESGIINKIRNLQIQFHDLIPEANIKMESICESLKKTHRPVYKYKFIWESWTLKTK